METLTLRKALELYDILGKYIPEANENEDMIEFIGKITHNIRASENHKDYINSIILMSKKEWKTIKELNSEEVLELFVEGLSVNKISSLKIFCDKIGFRNA